MSDITKGTPFSPMIRFEQKNLVTVTKENIHEIAKFIHGRVDFNDPDKPLLQYRRMNSWYNIFLGTGLEFTGYYDDGAPRWSICDDFSLSTRNPNTSRGYWFSINGPSHFKERCKEKYLDLFNSHWG